MTDFTETLTLRSLVAGSGTRDAWGNRTADVSEATVRGYVWFESGSEDTASGQVSRSVWKAVLEPDASPSVTDQLVRGGQRFAVVACAFRDAWGVMDHWALELEVVEGVR